MQTREVRTEWPAFYLTEWWLVTVLHLTMEIFILEVMQLVWSRRTEVFTMESGRNLRRFHKSALKPSRLVPLLRGKRALCPQEYYRSSCPRFKIRLLYIFEVPCSALISMFNALLELVAVRYWISRVGSFFVQGFCWQRYQRTLNTTFEGNERLWSSSNDYIWGC